MADFLKASDILLKFANNFINKWPEIQEYLLRVSVFVTLL